MDHIINGKSSICKLIYTNFIIIHIYKKYYIYNLFTTLYSFKFHPIINILALYSLSFLTA
jgi:hypothetical protein